MKTGLEAPHPTHGPSPEFRLFHDLSNTSYFFIVVNPASGGNAASVLLDVGFNYLEFRLDAEEAARLAQPASRVSSRLSFTRDASNSGDTRPDTAYKGDPINIKVFISDIRSGQNGNKDVFHIIKAIAHSKYLMNPSRCDVRLMVAGGDGTIMWAFSELQKHDVKRETVLAGIVPFGTGNDFANAVKSKVQVKINGEPTTDMIKRLVSEWITFKPARFDLWKLNLESADGGFFEKIDGKTRKKRLVRQEGDGTLPASRMQYAMANYFSLGVESRIGVGFDRNRTENALLNRGTYVMEGFKKMAFHRTRFINNWIDSCTIQADEDDVPKKLFQCLPKTSKSERFHNMLSRGRSFARSLTSRQSLQSSKTVPRLNSVMTEEYTEAVSIERANSLDGVDMPMKDVFDPNAPILAPCVSLLLLNIPSFAGGLNLWNAGVHKLGASLPVGAEPSEIWEKMKDAADNGIQEIGDGALEVVCFKSLMELSLSNLQRLIPPEIAPGAWRVYQGGGIYKINFRPDLDKKCRIYLQVDGEYFIAHRLRQITLRLDSQMQVLVHPSEAPKETVVPERVETQRPSILSFLDNENVQDLQRVGDPDSDGVRPMPLGDTQSFRTTEGILRAIAMRLE